MIEFRMPDIHRPDRSRHLRLLLSLFMTSSIARAATPADLSGLLDRVCTSAGTPGMVAVVLHGDQIVAQGAAGVRAAGSAQKVTIDDRFHLGSDTKAMTATLQIGRAHV